MNILYLCADRGIPVRGHKGAAVHVRAMSDAFVRGGHGLTILTPRLGLKDGPVPSGELIRVPLPPREGGRGKGDSDLDEALARDRQSQAYNEVLLAAARELIGERDFDFIYERYSLWSDVGARLSRETGLPLVLEVNAPLCEEAARYRHLSDGNLAAQVEASQFEAAQAIAVVSEALREYVVQKGARAEKVHLLPNGVDPQHFHPAVRGGAVHRRYGLHERIIVGFVGRARPWHDLDTLLQAVGHLHAQDKRYHLLLVGQMADDLPARLEQYGLSGAATVTGAVPHDAVPQHIAAMDVAVSCHLPMVNFYFSPLKLYEYLACGVPTVAADIGQPSELIQKGVTGYLYQPGNAALLAACIRTLVDNPAHARQVAWQGAVSVLTKHTWDQNAQSVVGWVQARPPQEELRIANSPRGYPLRNERNPKSIRYRAEIRGCASSGDPKFPPPPQHWDGLRQKGGATPDRGAALPIVDRKLRQRLYRATRPDLAQPLLARYLPAFGKEAARSSDAAPLQQIVQIEVLKYKPGRRCVLGYEYEAGQNGHSTRQRVIGKVFRDERGLRLHQLQDGLWSNGFGPNAPDRIHVPRSLGYVPKMRMQVQEYAPGETLDALIKSAKSKIRDLDLMPRTAQGIAKLHDENPAKFSDPSHMAKMRSYLLADEIKNLHHFTQKLATSRPESLSDAIRLRNALLEWAEQLPPLPAGRPIHRDFYYSQLLFHENRVTLIDFDLFALGDPAIDVANFAAHLTFLGMELWGDPNALSEDAHLFLESYARYRPVDSAFWERVAFYRAATFFRLLNVVASRPRLAHLFNPLYQQTVACLENGTQMTQI
ncbi:MAG: glycosyltransferase [Ardenticatenaceae bacterium]